MLDDSDLSAAMNADFSGGGERQWGDQESGAPRNGQSSSAGPGNIANGGDRSSAGPDFYNPAERQPTSIAQVEQDAVNLEAANDEYRRTHNGLDYADYQKYKDNIAGWREHLGRTSADAGVTSEVPAARQSSAAGQAPDNGGGWYADFGLGIGGGFNLHFDRDGVTGSTGAGLFGRLDVGYAFDREALVQVREENKIFLSAKLGKNGLGYSGEVSEKGDEFGITAGPMKLTVDEDFKPTLGTTFDVGPSKGAPAATLNGKAISFGFEGGFGWLHSGETREWATGH
jgi:hypothetical protein